MDIEAVDRWIQQIPCVTLTSEATALPGSNGEMVVTFTATEQIQGAKVVGYDWDYPLGADCTEIGNTLQCIIPRGKNWNISVTPIGENGRGSTVSYTTSGYEELVETTKPALPTNYPDICTWIPEEIQGGVWRRVTKLVNQRGGFFCQKWLDCFP